MVRYWQTRCVLLFADKPLAEGQQCTAGFCLAHASCAQCISQFGSMLTWFQSMLLLSSSNPVPCIVCVLLWRYGCYLRVPASVYMYICCFNGSSCCLAAALQLHAGNSAHLVWQYSIALTTMTCLNSWLCHDAPQRVAGPSMHAGGSMVLVGAVCCCQA